MPFIRRVGRPGLLGMAARTAVVAGTATAVSGAVANRQHIRAVEHQSAQEQELRSIAEQQAAAAAQPVAVPPVAPSSMPAVTVDLVAKLQELGQLHQQGLLSAEEFALAKSQMLRGI
ncbi:MULTISPECIES: SHOCT domain-containing protein [unclassified Leucobacter]|uniref:SHOCT domain-containing protein n=1 Tax=unclassified Leucobacter TaxID=2621730 RepID=UPI00165DCF5A|nr:MULTISPECIES: SHOCT domain-containing protein [unclassified Leucobacter]MBC9935917.1 SHOCT domain-containing protein [Leucobacter sp. cx-87]